ncbi:MAG: hypothetical protein C0436_00025 [Alphaproteobacteria bacterium]|nr:hypothetical protein [Alphaproteobacteria bacterium]
MATEVEILRGEGGKGVNAGSVSTIPLEHRLIHERAYYFVNRRVDASAAALVIHVKTGAKSVHFTPTTKTSGKTVLQIIEGVMATGDGTPIVCRNYNRNGTDDGCLTRAFHTPTYTGGTVIKDNQSGFGTNPGNAAPGESDGAIEYVLKPNTSYVFVQTPSASADQVFTGDFYEV